ncbi:MAG: hypothetical protein HEP71_15530 [Roseivirga sp.]|nr:hypothetical protein [Roseivirga sp.]
MLANLFKRKKGLQRSVASELESIFKQNPTNLQIDIYIKDQILFQIMEAKVFEQYNFQAHSPNNFAALHFFNKNKTLTFDKLSKFQYLDFGDLYYHFEEPKGNHNFIKEIGKTPEDIEREIDAAFKDIYELADLTDITIQYLDY